MRRRIADSGSSPTAAPPGCGVHAPNLRRLLSSPLLDQKLKKFPNATTCKVRELVHPRRWPSKSIDEGGHDGGALRRVHRSADRASPSSSGSPEGAYGDQVRRTESFNRCSGVITTMFRQGRSTIWLHFFLRRSRSDPAFASAGSRCTGALLQELAKAANSSGSLTIDLYIAILKEADVARAGSSGHRAQPEMMSGWRRRPDHLSAFRAHNRRSSRQIHSRIETGFHKGPNRRNPGFLIGTEREGSNHLGLYG